MTVIIKDGSFVEDVFQADGGGFVELDQLSLSSHAFDSALTGIDVPNDTDPQALVGMIGSVAAIRIDFPGFSDGRGYSIARRLRQMGFNGLLRAHGHIIADQYPLALRAGFDEVEIPAELAGRQPQSQWKDAFTRISDTYQERLMRAPPADAKIA